MRFAETSYTNPGQLDFVPRERRSHIWKVVFAFLVACAIIFSISFAPGQLGGNTYAALASISVVSLLCFYVVYSKQQSLDLVMATEYQNMLFAQAASLGSSFCMIVKRDGTVVYANDGIRKLFPQIAFGEAQMLDGIFTQGNIRRTDRERVMAAIYSNQGDRLVFPIEVDGKAQDYALTIEPLARPGGFLLLRGREYLDKRVGSQLMPDMLRSTSTDKLNHMLASTPVAHFVTDSFGRFEFVNPALERALGYGGGEIMDARLSIHHLIYQLGGQPISNEYNIADYDGEAILQKKQGSLLNVRLHQALIRDNGGKSAGATGSFLPQGA